MQLEGAAESDDQQQAADQAADQRRRNHLAGHGGQAVPLVAAVQAVLLAVAAPRLEDAQVGAAVEVSGLAVVAVLLVRAVRTPLLVVAALGRRVARAAAASLARELPVRAHGAGLLVAARRAVPVPVAALVVRVAALLVAARVLSGETVTFDL